MPRPLVLATRGSKLALTQSQWVAERLRAAHPGLQVELAVIKTTGDRQAEASLPDSGGQGLFTRELEQAILSGAADFAVHSLKDLPTQMPPGLALAAFSERADPRDVLVCRQARDLGGLPQGAAVGTSSPRRSAQLGSVRPDLRFLPLRGNVDTRLRKLDSQELDALVLAGAGLLRLGLAERITQWLPTSLCLPAAGQGILALQARADDPQTAALLQAVDDAASRECAEAERAALVALGGGCQQPLGVLAQISPRELVVEGAMVVPEHDGCVRARVVGARGAPREVGARLAQELLSTARPGRPGNA